MIETIFFVWFWHMSNLLIWGFMGSTAPSHQGELLCQPFLLYRHWSDQASLRGIVGNAINHVDGGVQFGQEVTSWGQSVSQNVKDWSSTRVQIFIQTSSRWVFPPSVWKESTGTTSTTLYGKTASLPVTQDFLVMDCISSSSSQHFSNNVHLNNCTATTWAK